MGFWMDKRYTRLDIFMILIIAAVVQVALKNVIG